MSLNVTRAGDAVSCYALAVQRPRPPACERDRIAYWAVRHALVSEDAVDVVREYLEAAFGLEDLEHYGVPDTSHNPIAASTKQLVTPGLYGVSPSVTSDGSAAAEALVGPDGYLHRVAFWPRSQAVQRYQVGSGIVFRRLGLDAAPTGGIRLTDRVVYAHDVIVRWDPAQPSEPVEIAELRTYEVSVDGKPREDRCCWDVYSLGDRRVYVAIDGEGVTAGPDVTAQVLGATAPRWEYADGTPYLPWEVYRAEDSGGEDGWPSWRRSMHQGTLRACVFYTFAGWAARFAQGSHHVLIGADLDSLRGVQRAQGDKSVVQPTGLVRQPEPSLTMRVHPGTISAVAPAQGQAAVQHVEIGSGIDLNVLQSWANGYDMELHHSDGLNPAPETRQSANPASGAALQISTASRREFSAQIVPWNRRADLSAIRKYAAMLTTAGRPTPETGYSIVYHTIPLSPDDQADLRAELDWQREHGLISDVDVYMRLHPDVSREEARARIVAARREQQAIEDQTRAATPPAPPRP